MTPDQINEFFSFLYQGRIGALSWWLRLFAGVFVSAALSAVVIIAVKLRELTAGAGGPAAPAPAPHTEIVARPWREVMRRLESANPADWNLAVIQADSIFDAVAKDMGLAGGTLGERLVRLDPSKLSTLNEVWEAHKIRNRIVHETDQVLAQAEARYAVRNFEKALRELQYLQD